MRGAAGLAVLSTIALASSAGARDYPVKPVPFTAVRFLDAFWAPKIETNRAVTVPFALEQCEDSKRVYHFERAAAVLRAEPLEDKKPPGYPFDDTDLYKVIEGAAYTLSVHRDPKLEAYLDELIAKIAAAQEPDGYLYTTRTIAPDSPHAWAGKRRWELEKVDSHELYNLGHLYEAAVAHYQATGKRTLLDVAIRTADLLDRTFGPGKQSTWPGHQITEMGLAKLYRATGDVRYLNLAKFLLDVRGPDGDKGAGRTYNQSHRKVTEQSEAVGHAVRATYMYSGMADVAALTGEKAYVDAIDRIWDDVASRKLYITGGIGATGRGEAFGTAYELPNMTAYNETCAAIGNDYWNHRLFLLKGDARYVDVMERTLYNGLLSGVSLDGRSFFYPNPLESNGQHQRSPWFGVACCPGNITRFLASLPGYVYAQQGGTLYVNLFVKSRAEVKLDSGAKLALTQDTRYPWDGAVTIGVDPEKPARFAVNVRIPGWARGEAVPSDLYRFADRSDEPVLLKVNGRAVKVEPKLGYATLERNWRRGDRIELQLPMPVRRVVANDAVAADRGRVALQRGPIVYAAEWPDNPEGRVRNLVLSDDAKLAAEFRPELLNGVAVVKTAASALALDQQGAVTRREQPLLAIPYYAWANRGPGQMAVWLARSEAVARPQPWPTLASTAKLTTSGGRNPRAINDQEEPKTSNEPGFHWWPKKGSIEWIEYALAKPERVSEVEVYWFDDTGTGQVRLPAAWRVLYRDGDDWKAVANASEYGLAKDRYNKTTFTPVTTTALRLEVTMQPEWSAGVQEWKVATVPAGAQTPSAAFRVTIRVDAGSDLGELEPIWHFFGADEPNYAYMKDGRKLLAWQGELMPRQVYFRTHNLLTSGDGTPALKWGSTNVYSEDAQGRPVYDWSIVDRIFDTYLERGVRPYVQVGFMPKALSSRPEPYQHEWRPGLPYNDIYTGWAYPPKDYAKWGELVLRWVEHCTSRYGRAEVESWYWETWNEANIGYWKGTLEEFLKLHDATVAAVRRALPNARVGGPDMAGSDPNYLRAFLEHCRSAGTPLDFIAFHAKGSPRVVDGRVQMGIAAQLRTIDSGFGTIASYPELRKTPIVIGESDPEGCAACQGPQLAYRNGTMYSSYTAASFARKHDLARKHGVKLEGALTWAFEFEDQPYFAGFRALASNGLELPVLNVFRMFAKMRGRRLVAESSGAVPLETMLKDGVRGQPDVAALASRDGRRVAVMIWHYHDDDVPGPDAGVELRLNGLTSASEATLTHYRVDDTHSNTYTAWKHMGSPFAPTRDQHGALQAAGKLATLADPTVLPISGGLLSVRFALPRQAVSLLLIG